MKNFKNFMNVKSIKKILFLLAMMCVMSLSTISVFAATTPKKVEVKVAVKAVTAKRKLGIGTTAQLVVKEGKTVINASKVKFKSSLPAVVTVDKKGLMTGKNIGKSIITISYGKKQCKLAVKVVRPVKSVSLNLNYLELKAGNSKTLTATVLPANATNKKITWASTNTTVASVSNNGTVTANKEGSATITATSKNGKRDVCYVEVKKKTTSGQKEEPKPTPTPTPTNNSLSVLVSGHAGYGYVGSEMLLNKAVLKGYTASDIEWKFIEGSSSLVELRPSGEYLYGTPKALGDVTIGLYLKGNTKCYGQFSYTIISPGGSNVPPKEITVEGVTFDLWDVEDSYVLDDNHSLGQEDFTIYTATNINGNDVTVKINGINIENFANPGIPADFTNKEYIYPNWENRKAVFHVDKNTRKNNKSEIYVKAFSLCTSENINLSIYYKNSLIKSIPITLCPITGEINAKTRLNYIEQNAWRDLPQDATLVEKLMAIQNFIGHAYPYSQMNCLDGASYLRDVAMDLGYYSRYAFNGTTEKNYYLEGGIVSVAHTWAEIYIPETNAWNRYAAEGHD